MSTPDTNGSGRKRSKVTKPRPTAVEQPPAPFDVAGFVPETLPVIDAQMWPVHPVVWLQPQVQPALPCPSGLGIEHRHRLPAPGLLTLGAAVDRRAPIDDSLRRPAIASELPPVFPCTLPESGLTPLGWDPRTERRGKGNA
jgi:hypothetical protein